MQTIHLANKMQTILSKRFELFDASEKIGVFDEKITHFRFYYHDDKTYPFELAVKIDRNWLDEEDNTPIVSIDFYSLTLRNGSYEREFDEVFLESETRKKALQLFYFTFEELVLSELQKTGAYGYKRDSYNRLFQDFRWVANGKAVTSSGRFEHVLNLSFESSDVWANEMAYRQSTTIAEVNDAKRYIRYFLNQNMCKPAVQQFLEYVLQSGKAVRLVNERSFWNYSFIARPDMLHADAETLSKLGYHIVFNHQDAEDTAQAMAYVFDEFSKSNIVNLCLDGVTMKTLHEESEVAEEHPEMRLNLLRDRLNNLNNEDITQYQAYETNYTRFLDGLLDLHLNYQALYQTFGEPKYQRKADKTKRLWFYYNN